MTDLVARTRRGSRRTARGAAGRDVMVLFGDGAGAVVVGRATDEDHMILSTLIHADGSEAEIPGPLMLLLTAGGG